MTSIGETLRRERLRRNLELNQISRELKISSKLLESIESEKFEELPGVLFAKSFVRQYAHMLGLDEEEMAAEVQRSMQPQIPLPRPDEVTRVAPIQVPKVEAWETVGDRGLSWASPLPALALVVVAMLVCSGVYAWYQRTHRPVLAQNSAAAEPASVTQPAAPAAQQPQPKQGDTATPAASPQQTAAPQNSAPLTAAPLTATPQTAPPVQSQTPAQTLAAQPASSTATPANPVAPPLNPSGPLHVQITASEPSWVLVRADGKFLFSGTLEANQTRTVDAANNLEVRLGNAGGVTMTLNGNPIGAVGPKGQVRTVQFTSGGFHIVAAPKPEPLIDPL